REAHGLEVGEGLGLLRRRARAHGRPPRRTRQEDPVPRVVQEVAMTPARARVARSLVALGALAGCRGEPSSQSDPAPAHVAAAPARVKPAAAVEMFFTGSDLGYLDACGCEDGLLGGLPRRLTAMRNDGYGSVDHPSLLVSNGRLISGKAPLDRRKLLTILIAMQEMRYAPAALTERELAL